MTEGSAADTTPVKPTARRPAGGEGAPAGTPSGGGRDRLAALTGRRESAFPEALRHTARVTQLRRWIIWGVGGTVALVGLGLAASSLRFLPIDLNLSRIALKGTRIVIETPKLVGYRKDGKPYEIRAKVGVQDISTPDVFDLDGLDVRVETEGANPIVLTAAKANYSTKNDKATLSGGVSVSDGKNFDMRMAAAAMDFKSSVMTSDQKVVLKIEGGEVVADTVEFSQKERRATFAGNVHSILYGEDEAAQASVKASGETRERETQNNGAAQDGLRAAQ
ncbi:LPS export ABC transporter periplasmic protein LptC [Methylocystis parvus]|uniref:LPS export ABC transporter periplasmic protein LptC n=1 Tax=Methylocystis parvus TaxID=134 RepID=A0A6B8MB45_9HYPH|nr:LPS export ABC transporter periplasmic protein LptC [Methylocystis parvus]QGM97880.1 LPS export ABC transporter periplasmic protein LptC [Methylocystis parvus]WBK01810.1 LPS export ABC transporter periplasmic protein LptC [Methylocystis parvus OBBP]